MPRIKEPLEEKCFQCKGATIIKYVQSTRDYSKKNNWEYWTKDEKNKGKKICDICLIKLYKNYKWEFRSLISSKKKQTLLRQYIADGKIKEEIEPRFILKKNKNINTDRERERERERTKWQKNIKN